MLTYKPVYLLIILILLFRSALAQTTISGHVVDATDKKPIPFATVFINSTSIGTRTAENGFFTLNNVKNGRYTLIISSIGYATTKQDLLVSGETIKLAAIELKPTARQLSEVKIKPRKELSESKKNIYLRWFLNEFLGRTENARHCKLVNPEILEYDYDKENGKFFVSAPEALVVENQALGYRVKYLLQSFLLDERNYKTHYTGYLSYEDLPGTTEQKDAWNKQRVKAYLGSQMHFFRACIADQVPQNEFTVFKVERKPTPGRASDSLIKVKINYFRTSGQPDSLKYWYYQSKMPAFIQEVAYKPLKANQYIKLTDLKGIYAFTYPNNLLINYKNKKNVANGASSLVTFLQEEAYFDSNGVIASPLALKNENYWGKLRIADALPHNYELPENIN